MIFFVALVQQSVALVQQYCCIGATDSAGLLQQRSYGVYSYLCIRLCLFLNIYTSMDRVLDLVGQTSFAVHQVRDGWEIVAPSDDPTTPAYWRVGVIRQYGWRDGSDHMDAPVTPAVRCDWLQYRRGRARS
jgi:hypothetical protein